MKLLIANWKMYLNEKKTTTLVSEYIKKFKKLNKVKVIVAPSDLYLSGVSKKLGKTKIKLASQDVASQDKGAYTGEVSASMLHEIGCLYALVGHSERRKMGETDEQINKKLVQCYHNRIIPILCLGENLEEKIAGQRASVLARQLRNAISKVDGLPENELIIAYEPVWAISSGRSKEVKEIVSPEEMYTVSRIIKRDIASLYSEKFYNEKVKLLYGGSVNSIVAKEFWNVDVVGGLLVGGASLDAEEFYNIAFQAS